MMTMRAQRGQSVVEYSVLVAAAVAAVIAVVSVARMAFSAYTIDIQEELGGRPDPAP